MKKDSWVEVIPATKNAMVPKQEFKKMRVAAYCPCQHGQRGTINKLPYTD